MHSGVLGKHFPSSDFLKRMFFVRFMFFLSPMMVEISYFSGGGKRDN